VDSITIAIFGWWILGGTISLVRPEWWEFLTRKFYSHHDSGWVRFWLSPSGRLLTRVVGVLSTIAGITGLMVFYSLM